jgi:CDP-paratose 2-epimerase
MSARKFFITGGAGFIGSNYVHRLLSRGEDVTIYDNLSRAGAPRNIEWLRQCFGEGSFRLVAGDVRDATLLTASMREAEIVVHLASQVTVTNSVLRPREDFEINAIGTFNLVEAARLSGRNPIVLYASTNKVYGGMEDVPLVENETNYRYARLPEGITETQPMDFHSPYGCSKGAGDQYVRDYHRIYGLPTVVFRQSCIYGTRQFGIEDQGWVAWFAIAAVTGRAINIYGDGKQVRDILFVDDLLDAYDAGIAHIGAAAGQVYNLGGGAANAISIWRECGPILERLVGHPIPVIWHPDWRPGDQRICVMDTQKAQRDLGWRPKIGVEEGLTRLVRWVQENRALFA